MQSHPYKKTRGVGSVTTQLTPRAEPASCPLRGSSHAHHKHLDGRFFDTTRRLAVTARYNPKMPVRFIALDIDGTLLDSSSELPEANRRAIEAATKRGIDVALVTGRRFDFALPVARQIRCPLTMIVNNGALVKSPDGVTYFRKLLDRGTAAAVLSQMPAEFRGGAAVVFDRPRENQVIYERIDWDDPRRQAYFLRNREFIAQVDPLENCLTEDPIQVMYSGSVENMRRAEAELRRMQSCVTSPVSRWP